MLIYFEGVACTYRHPWDVRVKVRSERKLASSETVGAVGIGTTMMVELSAGTAQNPRQ